MKIAVTWENGSVFPHFGHTKAFALYEVSEGKVLEKQIVPVQGAGHGALAGFLKQQGAEVLLCGGIGQGAQQALSQAGITLYGGVTGSTDDAVQAYLENRLCYDPEAKCSNPEHHHDHACGSGSCGQGGCGQSEGGCGRH